MCSRPLGNWIMPQTRWICWAGKSCQCSEYLQAQKSNQLSVTHHNGHSQDSSLVTPATGIHKDACGPNTGKKLQ